MIDILNLKEDDPKDFYEMITSKGQECFKTQDSYVIGVRVDEEAAGAIAVEIDGGNAVISSLYVDPKYRRHGIGTELVYQASCFTTYSEGVYHMCATFAESENDDAGLVGFFKWLDFDMGVDELHGAYTVTLRDASEAEVLKKASSAGVVEIGKVPSSVKNRLMGEHPSLRAVFGANNIETDMSCFVEADYSKDYLPDCLIFGKEDDELVMMWAQAEGSKMDIVKLLKFALEKALTKYGPNQKIRIPYINENSKRLVQKLLGEKAVVTETVYIASLLLDGAADGVAPEDDTEEDIQAG